MAADAPGQDVQTPTDLALLDAAAAGDERAFEALYLRHRGFVLAVAARFGARGDDGLDVMQETFADLAGRLPGFRLRARLTTWLYPVAKHFALKRRRWAGRFLLFGAARDLEPVLSPAPPGDVPGGGIAALVTALPPPQREVLLLRFQDGFSIEEIAAALEIPAGTVKSRLHNALAALRPDFGA